VDEIEAKKAVKSSGAEYTGYAKPSATICLIFFVLLCVPCVLRSLRDVSKNILCPQSGPGKVNQMMIISKQNAIQDYGGSGNNAIIKD
jgi:hypothetical protein